jgi:hypothetical protein
MVACVSDEVVQESRATAADEGQMSLHLTLAAKREHLIDVAVQ